MMQRFGEKLRALRDRKGLTLRELADELGYTNYGYISLLENGKKLPTAELVLKVSLLFEISADYLLRDDLELPDTAQAV